LKLTATSTESNLMSVQISITLDEELLKFIDEKASDRSQFINQLLAKAQKQELAQQLAHSYQQQEEDSMFQREIQLWDATVGDGLGTDA
ncbi:MAG: ribbon-helix-helix domain-containing protein, partial [Halothece sp.]